MKIKQFLALSPILLALLSAPVLAERPMVVDDAGTLDLYGKKLEFGFTRDHKERGLEFAAGFSPLENLEVEVNGARTRDHEPDPTVRIRGTGLALKWVPIKAEQGLSLGLKFENGRTRALSDPNSIEKANSLIGLATWTTEAEQRIHLNLGRDWVKTDADPRVSLNTWGVGFDQPLNESLRVTLETFGNEDSRPNRQLGLRWEVSEGLKLSVGVGRGNDRNFGTAGVAWEF